MSMKKIALSLLASTALVGAFAQPATVLAQDAIKIGANYELSGEAASYGQQLVDGLNLAIEQVNADGGLLDGQQVEAVVYDNLSDTTETASIAQRLISEDVVGIVGPAITS